LRLDKDYYRTLGVEPTASLEQIRGRFRALARRHHPDVAQDGSQSHEAFLHITEAYEVLGDPELREEYDQRSPYGAVQRLGLRSRPSTREQEARAAQPPGIDHLLVRASEHLRQEEWNQASRLCREAMERAPQDARPYLMIGDLHCRVGRLDRARDAYTMAQQLDPRGTEALRKLERLDDEERRWAQQMLRRERRRGLLPALPWALGGGLLGLLFYSALVGDSASMSGVWFLSEVPRHVYLRYLAGCGVAGATLALAGVLRRLDDELLVDLLDTAAGPVGAPPMGLLVLVGATLNLYFGMVLCSVALLTQDRPGRSTLLGFGATALLGLLFGEAPPEALHQMALWGTGPGFLCLALGWGVGDLLRPL
jgi:curved DNA-binding protein CbpA